MERVESGIRGHDALMSIFLSVCVSVCVCITQPSKGFLLIVKTVFLETCTSISFSIVFQTTLLPQLSSLSQREGSC